MTAGLLRLSSLPRFNLIFTKPHEKASPSLDVWGYKNSTADWEPHWKSSENLFKPNFSSILFMLNSKAYSKPYPLDSKRFFLQLTFWSLEKVCAWLRLFCWKIDNNNAPEVLAARALPASLKAASPLIVARRIPHRNMATGSMPMSCRT